MRVSYLKYLSIIGELTSIKFSMAILKISDAVDHTLSQTRIDIIIYFTLLRI